MGCGYWGPNLIRNFRSLPDCSLKMMCDVSENRLAHLRSLYPEVEGATNYNHMLNGVGLGCGHHRHVGQIALPDGQSEPVVRQAHLYREADGGLIPGM